MIAAIVGEWAALALRWLHVLAAMSWFGASFFLLALDMRMRRAGAAAGETAAWIALPGGLLRAEPTSRPPAAGAPLALQRVVYAAWISGFLLLILLYYARAELRLVDPRLLALAPAQGVLLSLASLVLGYGAYELLCRSPLARDGRLMAAAGALLAVLAAWAYARLFAGRAAMLHIGILLGTCMAANVGHVIAPAQRAALRALEGGPAPDPERIRRARERVRHNAYLALPVTFTMIAGHAPLSFENRTLPLVFALALGAGFALRHFLDRHHLGARRPWWSLLAAAAALALAVLISLPPRAAADHGPAPDASRVREIVADRCLVCHAGRPSWYGLAGPAGGVRLDSPRELRRHRREIGLQTYLSRAMPPGNVTGMSEEERALIARWAFRPGGDE